MPIAGVVEDIMPTRHMVADAHLDCMFLAFEGLQPRTRLWIRPLSQSHRWLVGFRCHDTFGQFGTVRNTSPGKPTQAISSRSLMAMGHTNCRLERGGIRVFKPTIEPFSHRNARAFPSVHAYDSATTWLLELLAHPRLVQSPARCPRSLHHHR